MQLSDLLSLALFAGAAIAAPPGSPDDCDPGEPPKGFVTTDGTEFKLDGEKFIFAGSNAYYFPFDNVSNPSFLTSIHLRVGMG